MKHIYFFFLSLFSSALLAQPTDNATDPPARLAEDVVSIYGDTYTNVEGINYNPDWGQSGLAFVDIAYDPGTGALVLAYPNFNYQGTELPAQDASLMENLHVDIWVAEGTERMVMVSPIDNSGNGPSESLVAVPLTPGAWNSVDLPKSAFTDMSWNSVFQMKFDGQFNADGSPNTDPFDIYLDNIYFWREPATMGTDATLSDIQIEGESLAGFASGNTAYNYGVPGGTTEVPQITSVMTTDANATTEITQATSVPGTATVSVTSADGSQMLEYQVSFIFNSPVDPAPTPTASSDDVISLFSDAYDNVAVDTWNTEWSNATFEDIAIGGNATKLYTNLGFNGIETIASPLDVSNMDFINFDIWTPNMDQMLIKLVDFLGDGFAGANGDTEAELTLDVVKGEWMTVSIALSDFTAAGMSAQSDLSQYIISSIPFGLGTLYLDNVYFSKMSSSSFDPEVDQVNVFPNPVLSGDIVSFSKELKAIELISMQGAVVLKGSGDKLDLQNIAKGAYIVKTVSSDNAVSIQKLIVN